MFTSHTRLLRLAQAGLLSATLTLGAAALSLVAPVAHADTAPAAGLPATVSADVLPTVQINGVAWDQVTVGNTVYVTGSFAYARPAGTPASSSSRVARANLLAYDITTGNLIPSFNHTLNAVGRSLAVSPNGDRLYVGGGFTTVDGATHTRIAAFDLTNGGALVTSFTGSANGTVFALAASNTTLYAGGSFSVGKWKLACPARGLYQRRGPGYLLEPGSRRHSQLHGPGSRRVTRGGRRRVPDPRRAAPLRHRLGADRRYRRPVARRLPDPRHRLQQQPHQPDHRRHPGLRDGLLLHHRWQLRGPVRRRPDHRRAGLDEHLPRRQLRPHRDRHRGLQRRSPA